MELAEARVLAKQKSFKYGETYGIFKTISKGVESYGFGEISTLNGRTAIEVISSGRDNSGAILQSEKDAKPKPTKKGKGDDQRGDVVRSLDEPTGVLLPTDEREGV